jgi:sugar fermentation stimulation protein A
MRFPTPLIPARLLRRYQRFLVDVELADGTVATAHTANTGAMRDCSEPGLRVWLSRSDNPRRKHPWTLELVETRDGVCVGVNTARSNALAEEAVRAGCVEALAGYRRVRREVRYGSERSRVDLLLEDGPQPDCYVEVKNVTWVDAGGVARFPDAPTARGRRHLRELVRMVEAGYRAGVFFCIQRGDARAMGPAHAVDPAWSEALAGAAAQGLELWACAARVDIREIRLARAVPVRLSRAG